MFLILLTPENSFGRVPNFSLFSSLFSYMRHAGKAAILK